MMIKPSLDELLDKIPNKFALVQAAIKRAKQIDKEKLPLPGADPHDSIRESLQEIIENKIAITVPTASDIKED